jgi:hypothetical protein
MAVGVPVMVSVVMGVVVRMRVGHLKDVIL